jgi:hypothetical protein
MMNNLALRVQIVKAIDRQSMKRNQLCFQRRAMIASSTTPALKYLRLSPIQTAAPRLAMGETEPINARNRLDHCRTASTRAMSSLIDDQLVRFMLACCATMQIHFIDMLPITDVKFAGTRAPRQCATTSDGHVWKCRNLVASSALNTTLLNSPAATTKLGWFSSAMANS